jgi:hypothetical protein
MRTRLCWLALAMVVAGGCSRDKADPKPAAGSSAAPTAPGVAATAPAGSAATAAGVELLVNGAAVGTVQTAQITGWPRLDSLVPAEARRLGTWEMITLVTLRAGAKPTDVPSPSTTYPDLVPALFPDGAGGVSFGMFDPVELAKKGQPALREDGLRAIRIKVAQNSGRGQNDDGGGGGGDPTQLTLVVTASSGTVVLSGEQILALPREAMPGNADQKGWQLGALLAAAGVQSYERLVLHDAGGANLTLDKKDLGPKAVAFIKLNKQGALRFRIYKKTGDGWNPGGGDLRGLTAIDVK